MADNKQTARASTSQAAKPVPAMATPVLPPVPTTPAAAPPPTQEPANMSTTADLNQTGAFRRPAFTVKRIITLPLLKLEQGKAVYVKFLGPIFTGKKLSNDSATDAEKAKAPPEMANVINLETGEQVQIMLGKVLQGILNEDYPAQAYVGKGFMIELTEKKRGRGNAGTYNTYKVAEIELP